MIKIIDFKKDFDLSFDIVNATLKDVRKYQRSIITGPKGNRRKNYTEHTDFWVVMNDGQEMSFSKGSLPIRSGQKVKLYTVDIEGRWLPVGMKNIATNTYIELNNFKNVMNAFELKNDSRFDHTSLLTALGATIGFFGIMAVTFSGEITGSDVIFTVMAGFGGAFIGRCLDRKKETAVTNLNNLEDYFQEKLSEISQR